MKDGWKMEDGGGWMEDWRMEDGGRMEGGGWRRMEEHGGLDDGGWKMEDGGCKLEDGKLEDGGLKLED